MGKGKGRKPPDYFYWLIATFTNLNKTRDYDGNPQSTYMHLADLLHHKDFLVYMPRDQDRVAWAVRMRAEYERYLTRSTYIGHSDAQIASIFEVLVHLGRLLSEKWCYDDRRMSSSSGECLFLILCNLGLNIYDDVFFETCTSQQEMVAAYTNIDQILLRWMTRSFASNGEGSPFPLINPPKDQRETDLMYQIYFYCNENCVYV